MTTTTATLASFLLARLAAEEAAWSEGGALVTQPAFARLSQSMLREVAAKRAIVAEHEMSEQLYCRRCTADGEYGDVGEGPCPTLRALASVYADHPAFDEAWR